MRLDPPPLWKSVFYPPPNYRYFEEPPLFQSSPKIGSCNLLKAAWMADAAMLAYGRSGPDPIPGTQVASILKDAGFVQCNLLGDWSAGARGTQGYFAYRDDFAVLAFRGTEKDDWHDLAADLATWPVDEDVRPRSAGTLEKTMFHLPSARAVFDSSKVGVHRGFQAALNEVWSDTARNLAEYRARSKGEIFFTGHSLGAALATLAISWFAGGNASLYTFGSPRVGNGTFLSKVQTNATNEHFRLVDNNDLVSRVPAALLWYAHSPKSLYKIDLEGLVHDLTSDTSAEASDKEELHRDFRTLSELRFPIALDSRPPDDIYDHSPGCYCNRLWKNL
jgi:Lipase (class 3)